MAGPSGPSHGWEPDAALRVPQRGGHRHADAGAAGSRGARRGSGAGDAALPGRGRGAPRRDQGPGHAPGGTGTAKRGPGPAQGPGGRGADGGPRHGPHLPGAHPAGRGPAGTAGGRHHHAHLQRHGQQHPRRARQAASRGARGEGPRRSVRRRPRPACLRRRRHPRGARAGILPGHPGERLHQRRSGHGRPLSDSGGDDVDVPGDGDAPRARDPGRHGDPGRRDRAREDVRQPLGGPDSGHHGAGARGAADGLPRTTRVGRSRPASSSVRS